MPIELPGDPTGDDYEDFVTAMLSTLGYFVETNLKLREGTHDLLECDIIATPMRDPVEGTILLEAKSGANDKGSVFEVYGKMQFLGIPRGCIVRPKPERPERLKALESIQQEVNVQFAALDQQARHLDLGCIQDDLLDTDGSILGPIYSAARYGRAAQRRCLQEFVEKSRERKFDTLVKTAREYRASIEAAFLARTPRQRARQLYEAYAAAPKITGQLVEYVATQSGVKSSSLWKRAMDTSGALWIQHAMIMEHTARLGIVKNGLLNAYSNGESTGGLVASDLPAAYEQGWRMMGRHPHRDKLPRLLQVFVFSFGGFYSLKDKKDLELIAAISGMPADQVVPALELMNTFFPFKGGWFKDFSSEIRIMKMVPAVLRGVGVFARKPNDQSSFCQKHPCTQRILESWQNALYEVLEPTLKTE